MGIMQVVEKVNVNYLCLFGHINLLNDPVLTNFQSLFHGK